MRTYAILLTSFAICTAPLFSARRGHDVKGHVCEEKQALQLGTVSLDLLSPGTRARPPIISGLNGEFRSTNLRDGQY